MRVTFYYHDQPEGSNLLLRLDNPRLVPGYILWLETQVPRKKDFTHVSMKIETTDSDGNIATYDISVQDYLRKIHENPELRLQLYAPKRG